MNKRLLTGLISVDLKKDLMRLIIRFYGENSSIMVLSVENYHGLNPILVMELSTDSPLDAGSPTPVQQLQISLGKTNAVPPSKLHGPHC